MSESHPYSERWKNSDAVLLVPKEKDEEKEKVRNKEKDKEGKEGKVKVQKINSETVEVEQNYVKFHVHTVTLALASPVFERMFESDFQEAQDKIVKLPGKNPDAVLEMLNIIYPVVHSFDSSKYMEELLQLAEEYEINKIKTAVDSYLLTSECSGTNLYLSQRFGLEKTESKNWNYYLDGANSNYGAGWNNVKPETKLRLIKIKATQARIITRVCTVVDCRFKHDCWSGRHWKLTTYDEKSIDRLMAAINEM